MNNKEKLYLVKQAGPWSEMFGKYTSAVAPTIAGATLGGIGSKIFGHRDQDALTAAMTFGSLGGGISPAVAGLLALITKTRSEEEQDLVDKGGDAEMMKNLLIPGYAQYNHYKRKGHLAENRGHPLTDS